MKNALIILFFISVLFACKNDESDDQIVAEDVYGFGVLEKVRGIWNGPVSSTTALGGFNEWIVDFRPISENHISAKNELDIDNDIFMSLFVTKYNDEHKIAFRNGGSFAGNQRTSYFLVDSVFESANESFYRFSEIINDLNRAYTHVICKQDSLIIKSFTNQYGTQTIPTPHMEWKAKLQDLSSSEASKDLFNFPQKTVAKDLTGKFSGMNESIFYNVSNEPFPESEHPHLGSATVSYSFAPNLTPEQDKAVILLLATNPLINGFNFNPNDLKYRSRYVVLDASDLSFTFNYLHPGTYYVYALYDNDGNNNFNSGDWISTENASFTLAPKGNSNGSAIINFEIP